MGTIYHSIILTYDWEFRIRSVKNVFDAFFGAESSEDFIKGPLVFTLDIDVIEYGISANSMFLSKTLFGGFAISFFVIFLTSVILSTRFQDFGWFTARVRRIHTMLKAWYWFEKIF